MLSSDPDRTNRPLGGWQGEMLNPAKVPSPPPAPQPLIIEPPPWHDQAPVGDLATAPPTDYRPSALESMKAADAEQDEDERPAPAPPITLPPLERPRIPEVDWRSEAVPRALHAAPTTDIEPTSSLQSRPAKKQRREKP
jgi:hypothetical protein